MYIIEGNNILLRYRRRRRAPKLHRITHLFVCPGISEITRESFHHKPCAHAHRVGNMEGFEDDQFQTCWRGRDFVNDDRDAGNCTGSCSRARFAGFLPEPGCRIRIKRDRERYGIGTQRLVCKRASKAPVSEALRQRSQVTEPQLDRSRPSVLRARQVLPWFEWYSPAM